MISLEFHSQRRAMLCAQIKGPILLMGNGSRMRNLPMNHLPFRQDSTFLYFTGCTLADTAAVIWNERLFLFAPPPAPDDSLWHGPVPDLAYFWATFW